MFTNFFLFVLIVPCCCLFSFVRSRPGCLHSEDQLDLTNYPVSESPVSWILSVGSSLFPQPDYLAVSVAPNCNSPSFRVSHYRHHLNTTSLGDHVLITEKVATTQELARDYVGLAGFVVIADQQTNGKARAGQTWNSPLGDVYMSVNVNLTDRSLAPLLQSVAALSVVNAIHEKRNGYQNIDLAFVWPNSVAWNNRKVKIVGILVEPSPADENWFTIGMGIRLGSVAGVPTLNSIIAAHNHMHGTQLEAIRREEMVARVLNNLETLIELLRKDSDLVRQMMIAKWVSQKKNINLSLSGFVTGINSDNELILKDLHGLKVLINPDLNVVLSEDKIIPMPSSYSSTSRNSIYESEL